MLSPAILVPAVLNGLMTGAVYALIALGLTLIYGVLHIINFAHGALLTAAMFAAFFAYKVLGLDPYLAAVPLAALFFGLGYALQRFVIGPAGHGDDRNILLVTLGLAIVIENALLVVFRADTRTINLPYAFDVIEVGTAFLAVPRVIAFAVVILVALALWLFMRRTDTGKAIRAVAKEKLGAELSGIDVGHIYAVTFVQPMLTRLSGGRFFYQPWPNLIGDLHRGQCQRSCARAGSADMQPVGISGSHSSWPAVLFIGEQYSEQRSE